jgi:hypothetical protein
MTLRGTMNRALFFVGCMAADRRKLCPFLKKA